MSTVDMLFEGNVLKKKFFRDVQDAKKRSKTLAQQIFTCLDGELYQHDEVSSRKTFVTLYLQWWCAIEFLHLLPKPYCNRVNLSHDHIP